MKKQEKLDVNENKLLKWICGNANGIETTFNSASNDLGVTDRWVRSYVNHLQNKGYNVTVTDRTFKITVSDYDEPVSDGYKKLLKVLTNRVKYFGSYVINREWLIENLKEKGYSIDNYDINRAIYDERFEVRIMNDKREQLKLKQN